MANETVIERLKKMLVKQLNLNRDPASMPDNEPLFKEGLGLDSLDSLEIIVGIEREFKIKISDENLKKPEEVFKSVGALADFVENLISNQ